MGLHVKKSIFKSVRLDKKILDFKPAQTDSLAFVNPIILTILSINKRVWIPKFNNITPLDFYF